MRGVAIARAAVLASLAVVAAGCTRANHAASTAASSSVDATAPNAGSNAGTPSSSSSAASSSAREPARKPLRGRFVGEYAAIWDQAAGALTVEARLPARVSPSLRVDRGVESFVRDVEVSPDRADAGWSDVERRGDRFVVPACEKAACRVRYRVALREAARAIDDVDVASEEGEVIEAPPSTWLLAPPLGDAGSWLRFRVITPDGSRFVTGVFPSPSVAGAWDIALDDLWTSPYSAFGPLRVQRITVPGGSAVDLAVGPGALGVSDETLARWTETSARAVAEYFSGFPMPSALVLLIPSRGAWVGSGRTLAGGGGAVFVRIGERAKERAYRDDWVLTHEMIHLAFPSVPRQQDWAEEGIATYAEPFARVRAGALGAEEAWAGLASGLPNGLPGAGDRGLDHTHTWGRTYWGGALFWFLADVEIRKRTHNRLGLEHALRGIVRAGGTNATRWPFSQVLAVGDRATGTPVLTELYAAMRASPHPVDLRALMTALGVERVGRTVRFDDSAPLAAVRRAITTGPFDTDAPDAGPR